MQLLKETTIIERNSRWSEIKKKIDSDPRYKAVESSSRREDWFRDYVKNIEEVSFSLFISCKIYTKPTNYAYVYILTSLKYALVNLTT